MATCESTTTACTAGDTVATFCLNSDDGKIYPAVTSSGTASCKGTALTGNFHIFQAQSSDAITEVNVSGDEIDASKLSLYICDNGAKCTRSFGYIKAITYTAIGSSEITEGTTEVTGKYLKDGNTYTEITTANSFAESGKTYYTKEDKYYVLKSSDSSSDAVTGTTCSSIGVLSSDGGLCLGSTSTGASATDEFLLIGTMDNNSPFVAGSLIKINSGIIYHNNFPKGL